MTYYKTITILILFNMRKTSVGGKDQCIWPCNMQYVCNLTMAFLDMLRKRDCWCLSYFQSDT